MKQPRHRSIVPRNGWNYTQPETGAVFTADHPKVLERRVFEHRLSLPQLGLDCTGGWQKRLWHEVCLQNPDIPSEDTDNARWFPNLVDILRFMQTMWTWRRNGGGFVPQEEAERRATVCLTGANGRACPHNEPSSLCLGCKGVSEQLSQLVENRKTSQDNKLMMCSACGCNLHIKVHFPIESIHVDEDKLPPWCWQRKTVAVSP